jgi:hypothetical protein
MRSLYDFIVEPVGDAYENEIEIENVKIILNNIGFIEIQKSALKVEFSKENEKAEEVKKKLEG